MNLARAFWVWSMRTTQVLVPRHAPDHPRNVRPLSGLAVRVTSVPAGKSTLHDDVQLSPLGEEVTPPLPDRVSASA